jgi:hypothetical protein
MNGENGGGGWPCTVDPSRMGPNDGTEKDGAATFRLPERVEKTGGVTARGAGFRRHPRFTIPIGAWNPTHHKGRL